MDRKESLDRLERLERVYVGRKEREGGRTDGYLEERSINCFQAVSSTRIHTDIELSDGFKVSNRIRELVKKL